MNRSGHRHELSYDLIQRAIHGDPEALEEILNEVKYLRQEVEFLKKIVKTENTATRKS